MGKHSSGDLSSTKCTLQEEHFNSGKNGKLYRTLVCTFNIGALVTNDFFLENLSFLLRRKQIIPTVRHAIYHSPFSSASI